MTNDTNTLNGALTELGELMADNLVTMGVTDADASDGLTTLANKILDVPQGGSGIAIALSSDKSILSYYNSETATLTATVTENGTPKNNVSVQFYKDNVAYGNPVSTDSSGIATITYSSTGSGDVSLTAKYNTATSSPLIVEDCIFYDSSEHYVTTSSNMSKGKFYNNFTLQLPQKYEWSMDMKVSSTSGSEDRLLLTPTEFSGEQPPYGIFCEVTGSHMRGGVRNGGNTYGTSSYISASANTYYPFKAIVDGTTISYSVNNTDVGSSTNQSWLNNYTDWWFAYDLWKRPNITCYWKNVKVKAL